ncbi:putative Ig domain-containing protein [Brevifollis gellanilyticus]|uniref:Ig-like domain-containing protein n=1 Tax=Brevifollis gellanilyticus TaxID=748831 RepID=A0A512MH58_9BACT|nr:putative Ig domain-containing protein [Brevifollis gellanilyticus]GEP46077.1 hypothetical protein BGE01nite_53680 [Brevifollis gellanilyticus]
MKKSPPTFRRLCLALVMTMAAPWASGQLVQTLKDINTTPVSSSADPDAMALAGGNLFISTDNALSGSELWKYTVLASFNGARGVVADAAGNLYVLDTASHVIRKVSTTGAVSVFAGSPGVAGSADGAGMAAQFNTPTAIAIVTTGPNIGLMFVADTNNHTIRRVTPQGVVTTQAGKAGQVGFIDNNTLDDARFRFPRGIAARQQVGANMEVFVSDSGNNAIRRITIQPASTQLVTLAGSLPGSPTAGQAGSVDGTGASARFNNPGGISLAPVNLTDDTGNVSLFLADTGNNCIRRVGLSGRVVTSAGSTTPGAANGIGLAASFNAPQSVVCDNAANLASNLNVYVADTGNNLIRVVQPKVLSQSANQGVVTTLAGSGAAGGVNGVGAAASFNAPRGVGLVGTNLIVADTGNHVLRNVVASGAGVGTVTLRAGQVGVAGGLDGAATGTATPVPVQVADINPGSANSLPQQLTPVGNALFFTAQDGNSNRDLWKTDGTPVGTIKIGNTDYPSVPGGPQFLTAVGNTLYFQGYGDEHGSELWKSDGTKAGTVEVQNIYPGVDSSLLENFYAVDSPSPGVLPSLLFGATDGTDGVELRKIGPPNAATSTRVADLFSGGDSSSPSDYIQFDGWIYFVARSNVVADSEIVGRELFKLNLASLNAPPNLVDMLVADIAPQGDSEPRDLVVSGPGTAAAGGQLFFSASTTGEGRELYVMNAANSLTPTRVKDLNSDAQDSGIDHITPITVTKTGLTQPNGVLFTGDEDQGQGLELYFSNGNPNDTGIVKNLSAGSESSILDNFFSISSGVVIFTKEETDGKIVLYRTDGTSDGTVPIEEFDGEPDNGNSTTAKDFRAGVLVGSNLYFMLSNDELWRTNGQNDAGTVLIHRFRTSTESSDAQGFTRLSDGRVVFSAITPDEGREPWITDLAGSTTILHDIQTGTLGSDPQSFTATHDGRLYFTAEATPGNRELYLKDVAGAPTLVQDINPTGSADPQGLLWVRAALPANNKLYFSASDGGSNRELWVMDNANALTEIEVDAGSGSHPENITAYKDFVYFSAETNAGVELWRTDGVNLAGTTMVKDIFFGSGSSNPAELAVMPAPKVKLDGTLDYTNTKLYFIATGNGTGITQDQETGRELWVTDGTAAGTKVVKDIISGGQSSIDDGQPAYLTVVGNALYFVADDDVNGRELWKSDGTPGGTVMVKNIHLTGSSDPTDLRSVNGKLFFVANDGTHGRELWMSNGTATGTVMVSPPGRTGIAADGDVLGGVDAGIQDMTVIKDVLTFTADDRIVGREIWITDGTAVGTTVMTEFVPGPGSSYPHNLAAVDDKLLFSASDVDIGDEPRVAILSSKLVVTLPPHGILDELAPGATVDLTPTTPVAAGSFINLVFRLSNKGTTGIANTVATISGLHAADFTVFKKPGATISAGQFTEVTIQFKPKEGGERTAMLRITSTDGPNPILDFNLTADCTKDPTIASHPVSQIVKVGAPVTLSSSIIPGATAPVTLQWKKNKAPVAGATLNPLYLWSAKLTDGGAYTAEFKSGAKAPNNVGTSDIAQLAVVEDFMPARVVALKAATTKGATITVNATGNGLTYLWKYSLNSDLSSPQALPALVIPTTVTTKTLGFSKTVGISPAEAGYYFCEVTSPAGTVVGGTTYVKVFNATPEFVANPTLPTGIVGSAYFHQLATNPDPLKAPLTYSVVAPSKLPLGLKLDPKTGVISGIPTKVETQSVTFKVANGLPTAAAGGTVIASITIVAMPVGLEGTFQGLVERNEEINGSAGGRIEIVLGKLGSFSGKLIQGATTDPFKGNLMFDVSGGQAVAPFTGMARIIRKGISAPLDLTFTIDPTNKNFLTAGNVASVNVGGAVNAEVYAWKMVANLDPYRSVATSATNTNTYNFGIRLPAQVNSLANPNIGSTDVPQGTGYGTFLISKTGTLTIAGMTADGEKITCATFVGPNGEVLLYQSLYTTTRKGSVCGLLVIGTGVNAASPNDNVLNTNTQFPFDWTRPPSTAVLSAATNTRTYRAGFGLADTPVQTPVELEAFGGYYQPGAAPLLVSPPSTATGNEDKANLTFTGGGVNLSSTPSPSATHVTVTATKATVMPVANATTTKFASAVLKTGIFTGSFVLKDDDETTTTPATKVDKMDEIKRTVNFLGLIVPENGGTVHRGVGYYLLPQIPVLPTDTVVTKQTILSGQVNFDKDP